MRIVLLAALSLVPSLAEAREIVWVGIDYGEVHMVGTGDFRDPGAIFPGYLDKWNVLLLDEQLDDIGKQLRVDVVAEVSHLSELHRAADPDTQIVRNDLVSADEPVLAAHDVARRVASYELTRSGTGLVFVADQLNKPQERGCYWVTFFDLESRHVLSTDRRCGNASGFGFRNYWFGTVKNVIDTLQRSDLP